MAVKFKELAGRRPAGGDWGLADPGTLDLEAAAGVPMYDI